jgi:glutathione peroxidase-family protein
MSLHSLSSTLNDGTALALSTLAGKPVLIMNVASL